MITTRMVGSILISAGLFVAASASAQTSFTQASTSSVAERYFQREAANYQKFEQDGQIVYCTSAKTGSEALIPHIGYARCISETDLRRAVRDWRRDRVTTAS